MPPHRILSQSEAEAVLKKYKLSLSNLPKIFVDDPQAKKLKAKVGDILEIDRGEEGLYYRLVVPRQ